MDNQVTGKGIIEAAKYMQSKLYPEKNIWTLRVKELNGAINFIKILHPREAKLTKYWSETLKAGNEIAYLGYVRSNKIYALNVKIEIKEQQRFNFDSNYEIPA